MKKFVLMTLLAAFAVLFVSCNEDADDLRANDIYGDWEIVFYNEDSDLNYVDTFSFKPNGTFERHGTYRNPDTGDLVGYHRFQIGEFTLNGNAIQLHNNSYLWTQEWYVDFEDLEPVDADFDSQAVLSLQNGNSELVFDFGPCDDAANCVGTLTYERISGN